MTPKSQFKEVYSKAEQGHADAQYNLGRMYYYGYPGIKRDCAQAVKWLRKAAEQGNADAQLKIGNMYYTGQDMKQDYIQDIKQDYTLAAQWYRKSAEQGNAEAQYTLGLMYVRGYGVSKDYTQAAEWYRKSADQGHAEALLKLGWMYSNGQGVKQDDIKAVDCYYKAGQSFLKKNDRDNALTSVRQIKELGYISNASLADKLLAQIEANTEVESVATSEEPEEEPSTPSFHP